MTARWLDVLRERLADYLDGLPEQAVWRLAGFLGDELDVEPPARSRAEADAEVARVTADTVARMLGREMQRNAELGERVKELELALAAVLFEQEAVRRQVEQLERRKPVAP